MACGTALDGAAAPAHEERRTVTVLFADLAGFTARAEAMDPEDVRAFLHPWYELLQHEVAGHGGVVERHLGDGVMALFGAPTAHEDDPERAVRSALRILGRLPGLGLDLHARLGVNTGEVLFASATGPGREDAVTGDAVNTAARLQAAAPVDGVVVGEPTYRATSRLFTWEELPPIAAKGKADPVPAWRPIAAVARVHGEPASETTPFVGRDHELQTLVRLFERTRSTPGLEVVTVIADPGLGKSRLVRELGRHVDALPDLVTWRVGRCLPYGEGIGLWALSEIVKAQAGILDTDDQVTLSAKLAAALVEPDPSLRAWMKDRLAPLVGLETATQPPQQEEAYTAWRRFLESIAQAGPLVLVVEDLHSADAGFVAFLQHVAGNIAGLPVLLLVTARPELEERHPGWLARARHATVISLDALADHDMTTLLTAAFPDAAPDFVTTILDRAAGSPLYAEQLAAMARDRPEGGPLDEVAIPPTISALLAARIDALPAAAKAVLLDASVVGKTFWSGAVAALGRRERADVEPLLAELARRDLVRPVHPSSMADEQEYAFVHALARDVAYGELTRAARLARHKSAAAWITERAGAALGEDAEIVVAHLERALELADATGAASELPSIRDGLVDALLTTAETVMRTDAGRAAGLLRRAIDRLGAADRRRAAALARLGTVLIALGDTADAARILEQAINAHQAAGDERAAAYLTVPLAIALGEVGEVDRARQMLAEARVSSTGDPGPELVEVLAAEAHIGTVEGRADAAALADEAIRLAGELGRRPPTRALMARGLERFFVDPAAGEADLRAAAEEALAQGDLRTAVDCHYNRAVVRGEADGPEIGLLAFDEAIEFARTHGLSVELMRVGRPEVLFSAGRWDECLREAETVLAWARDHGDAWASGAAAWCIAVVRLERGEPVDPQAALERLSRTVATPPSILFPVLAEKLVVQGDPGTGRGLLAEALAATQPRGLLGPARFVRACLRADAPELARRALTLVAPLFEAETLAARGMLAEVGGDLDGACVRYRDAAGRFAARGELPELAYALAGLGGCLVALGETVEGAARLQDARELWVGMRAKPRIAEIDEILAGIGEGT